MVYSAEDVRTFRTTLRQVLSSSWGKPTDAEQSMEDVAKQAQDFGLFDFDGDGDLAFVTAAIRETGRVSCPLPVMDAFVARRLGVDDCDGVVVASSYNPSSHAEAGALAVNAVILPLDDGKVRKCVVRNKPSTPGIPKPDWSHLDLEELGVIAAGPAAIADALALMRLGLATRALAAAERTHELAVEHAKTRKQFGKVIGEFGAVQQRTAAREIEVRAANALLDEAVTLYDAADPTWRLATEIAVTWATDVVSMIQLDAHHTLGAMGFFEEHEAPWLFRRVQADLVRINSFRTEGSGLGDILAEGENLPALSGSGNARAFRNQLRTLFAEYRTADSDGIEHYDEDGVLAAMAQRGLFGMGWPESIGGRDASMSEQVTLTEEITYGRVPAFVPMGAVAMIGNTIVEHGTEEQRETYLPLIQQGKLRFCLGYSEPEAGSDLASLRTRAVRHGDEWEINGQKIWTTRGHESDYVWLATRTDPDAQPQHAGITVFLVPMDTPGITVHQHRALSGAVSCSVFYDNVRVPDSARIGEVNGGWRVITFALAGERIHMAGVSASVLRQLDDFLDIAHENPEGILGSRGSAARAALATMAAKLQATRALIALAVAARAGKKPDVFAPMAGILAGELAEEFGMWILQLLGPDAALSSGTPGAIADGVFEAAFRLSPMYVIGGGTNDIQRSLIARSLGLPRTY